VDSRRGSAPSGQSIPSERPLLLPRLGRVRHAEEYRRPLLILAILVALVLLIAWEYGNLLTAQAAARAREMATGLDWRGQWRLIQLVLVESAILAAMRRCRRALLLVVAPIVVSMLAPADRPVRLVLDADWRGAGIWLGLDRDGSLCFSDSRRHCGLDVKPISR